MDYFLVFEFVALPLSFLLYFLYFFHFYRDFFRLVDCIFYVTIGMIFILIICKFIRIQIKLNLLLSKSIKLPPLIQKQHINNNCNPSQIQLIPSQYLIILYVHRNYFNCVAYHLLYITITITYHIFII